MKGTSAQCLLVCTESGEFGLESVVLRTTKSSEEEEDDEEENYEVDDPDFWNLSELDLFALVYL